VLRKGSGLHYEAVGGVSPLKSQPTKEISPQKE
jgi:hypothetical protein